MINKNKSIKKKINTLMNELNCDINDEFELEHNHARSDTDMESDCDPCDVFLNNSYDDIRDKCVIKKAAHSYSWGDNTNNIIKTTINQPINWELK